MHRDLLDAPGQPRQTVLLRLPPRAKLLAALALVSVIAFTPPTFAPLTPTVPISRVHIAVAVLLGCGFVAGRAPMRHVAAHMSVVLPALFLLALSVPLAHGFRSGWEMMGRVLVKGFLSVLAMMLLAHTTPMEDMLRGLRQLGLPGLFVLTLAFMYRYLFILREEMASMRRGWQARCFRPSRLSDLKGAGRLVGMLLARSLERAERVHAAMLARGFDGGIKTLGGSESGV